MQSTGAVWSVCERQVELPRTAAACIVAHAKRCEPLLRDAIREMNEDEDETDETLLRAADGLPFVLYWARVNDTKYSGLARAAQCSLLFVISWLNDNSQTIGDEHDTLCTFVDSVCWCVSAHFEVLITTAVRTR